ncbi:hypothetical protein GCM10010400_00920 [Streptomyces aculeolatus]
MSGIFTVTPADGAPADAGVASGLTAASGEVATAEGAVATSPVMARVARTVLTDSLESKGGTPFP